MLAHPAELSSSSHTAASDPADHALFHDLHARFDTVLKSMYRRRLHRNDPAVDDLSQRVWAAFWRALAAKRFDPGRSAPSTFLYAIAHNTWVQHVRERARGVGSARSIYGHPQHLESSVVSSPERSEQNTIELAETLQRLRTLLRDPALAGLSEVERDVLIAAAQGEPDRAVASRLNMAASTVHARRQSASDKVRLYLTGKPPSESS